MGWLMLAAEIQLGCRRRLSLVMFRIREEATQTAAVSGGLCGLLKDAVLLVVALLSHGRIDMLV